MIVCCEVHTHTVLYNTCYWSLIKIGGALDIAKFWVLLHGME